jgi:hypothetical protein
MIGRQGHRGMIYSHHGKSVGCDANAVAGIEEAGIAPEGSGGATSVQATHSTYDV